MIDARSLHAVHRFSWTSVLLLLLPLLGCGEAGTQAKQDPVGIHHELSVRLVPSDNRLVGNDTITLPHPEDDKFSFYLSENAEVTRILVNGRATDFRRNNHRIIVPATAAPDGGAQVVSIEYNGRFDDPAPVMPVNTDNPGYGVTGAISDDGVFLLGGAGWYPAPEGGSPASFRIEVSAPGGMVAVTAGRSAGIRSEGGRTVSTWEVTRAVEPLALSAGLYEVREAAVGDITAATYLLPQSRDLADGYLAAVGRFIRMYETLFGPYPFEKFAVVENFFPTGYGFPSYTLLGTTVLHLPFIKHTSLGHEVAHCWWGNGVGVDVSRGNWSEGLTSYVSDYLYQEQRSPEDGTAHRWQLLRNYAAIVQEATDFPLHRFRHRTDPVTKVIGYDKGAMVFHMLRRQVGDTAFWESLRKLYRDHLFEDVSWTEIQTVFESVHGRPLAAFFEQWLDRTGALQLRLENVAAKQQQDALHVSGTLRQKAPFYRVQVPVAVLTGAGEARIMVEMSGETADFDLSVPKDAAPRNGKWTGTVTVDPEADLFRRLYPSEVPPSINGLKGSNAVLLVVPDGGAVQRRRAGLLAAALGLDRAEVVEERDLSAARLQDKDIIFMAMPRDPRLLKGLTDRAAIDAAALHVGGNAYPLDEFASFMVFSHPEAPGRIAALLSCPDGSAEAVIRKIPHYGKYSYLVFRGSQNQDKGIWPIASSPLVQRF